MKRIVLSRHMAVALGLGFWSLIVPLFHGVVPWAISRLTPRFGWDDGRPGIWNLPGLLLVVIGAAGFICTLVPHSARVPERVEMELTPQYLLRGGVYRWSRNPMFLAELALWTGWTLFYGSLAVFIGSVLLWFLITQVVRFEERALEARFGEEYLQYRRTVPRWLGKRRS